MLIMDYFDADERAVLIALGKRLKQERLARNESQELFAQRLGLTRQSYARMEQGAATVSLGHWLKASSVLGLLDTWGRVLARQEDLFSRYDRLDKGQRQRARRKRKPAS